MSEQPPRRDWRRQAAGAELVPGTTVRFSRTFSAEEVAAFGHLIRDYNPVHNEDRWVAAKGFAQKVCHGMLIGSMICEPGGQWGWLASGMSFRFLRPVPIGEAVHFELRIVELDERGKARAEASWTDDSGQPVLQGELTGYLPNAEERALLGRMLDEGDGHNPLTRRGEP